MKMKNKPEKLSLVDVMRPLQIKYNIVMDKALRGETITNEEALELWGNKIQFVDPIDPFTATGNDRYIIDEMGQWPSSMTTHHIMTKKQIIEKYGEGMFPIGKEPRFPKVKIPIFGKRIPRKKKSNFYIVKNKPGRFKFDFPPGFKGLYEQVHTKGKLVPYGKERIDLSWMKPIVQKFTPVGKKITNLIKKLYGRRIRK